MNSYDYYKFIHGDMTEELYQDLVKSEYKWYFGNRADKNIYLRK